MRDNICEQHFAQVCTVTDTSYDTEIYGTNRDYSNVASDFGNQAR